MPEDQRDERHDGLDDEDAQDAVHVGATAPQRDEDAEHDRDRREQQHQQQPAAAEEPADGDVDRAS